MSEGISQLEKKVIIIKNALQIIDHLNIKEFPRWKEFINRKIDTFVSTIWQLYNLGDIKTARLMMQKIVELEIIRDNPELVLGIKSLSPNDVINNTSFKYTGIVETYDNEKISAEYSIINPKEKHYTSIEEAVRNKKGRVSFILDFIPNLQQYNKIVATHYNKALIENDIISLIAAVMFFSNFSDEEITKTLQEDFNYFGKIPPAKNLKYVAIVWGNENHFKSNQATLSIPCEEMEYNQDDGQYSVFFSRGYESGRDVVQYSDDYFSHTRYSKFSEIYSAKFNNCDAYPYEMDNFYAIFA